MMYVYNTQAHTLQNLQGQRERGGGQNFEGLKSFLFSLPPSPGQERSRSRVSFDFWPEESPSREKPFFSLEGGFSSQVKTNSTPRSFLSRRWGSQRGNDFKPSKFQPPPLFLSTPIGSTMYGLVVIHIHHQLGGPLSNVPSPQPIILIGSHRSSSSFLATDGVPHAPPFFY